jgi:4,4'-diaponeurosporenoate glycosyltransferase
MASGLIFSTDIARGILLNPLYIWIGLLSGLLMLWRVPGFSRNPVRGNPDLQAAAEDLRRLSVVIPAYTEQDRLPPLLDSLSRQRPSPLEVLVVDDGSTDRTAGVAEARGFRVIRSEDPGPGWIGKSRACWTGARHTTGAWLLFLDADVTLDTPDALARLCAAYRAHGADGLLSWQPYHRTRRLYESFSLFFSTITLAGIGVFTPLGERMSAAGAFGPALFSTREAYEAAGGHRAVHGEVMEDLALGRRMRMTGHPVRCFPGRGILSFRMYPDGVAGLVEGWTKNFSTGAAWTHPLILLLCVLWVTGGIVAAVRSCLFLAATSDPGQAAWAAVAYLGYVLLVGWNARKAGHWHPGAILLYPVPLVIFVLVFVLSWIRTRILRRVSWRGRSIDL